MSSDFTRSWRRKRGFRRAEILGVTFIAHGSINSTHAKVAAAAMAVSSIVLTVAGVDSTYRYLIAFAVAIVAAWGWQRVADQTLRSPWTHTTEWVGWARRRVKTERTNRARGRRRSARSKTRLTGRRRPVR